MSVKVTLENVQKVVGTFPMSYYFGKGFDYKVRVSANAKTSSCCDSTKEIVVALANIKAAAANMGTTEVPEEVIRGLFYHELSHAILTPKSLFSAYISDCRNHNNSCSSVNDPSWHSIPKDEINILEDERIEAIFSKFYMNVDFWKNRLLVLGKCVTPATTKEQYLFNVVRYHETEGHPGLLGSLRTYIALFNDVSAYSILPWSMAGHAASLVEEIYETFAEMHKPQEEKKKSQEKQKQSEEEEEEEQAEQEQGNDESEEDEEEQEEEDNSGLSTEGEGNEPEAETEAEEAGKDGQPLFSEEETGENAAVALDSFKSAVAHKLNKLSAFSVDAKLKSEFVKIIAKNGGFGVSEETSTEGYCGEFDPELKMSDFSGSKKWWNDSDDYGNATFTANEKVLNIWLDNSGSFSANDDAVNDILAALHAVEQIMPSFHFNLVSITEDWVERTGDDRVSNSDGNNDIPEYVKDIYNKLNSTGNEKNIVLFDGQAAAFAFNGIRYSNLSCFNNSSTTFIIESSNSRYVNKYCSKARIIVRNSGYSITLKENVTKAIDALF